MTSLFDVVSITDQVEETLKWGEPSYLIKNGSTIRIDWKKSKPDQYAIYFHCKTKLVDTCKEPYKDKFKFKGNRAIVFHKNDKIPVYELKHCFSLFLSYHNIKHLPMLGGMIKTHWLKWTDLLKWLKMQGRAKLLLTIEIQILWCVIDALLFV